MTVTRVREDRVGNRGNADEKGRDYVRTFTVETDSPYDDSLVVRAAPGIPRVYNPYVSAGGLVVDLGSWCRTVTADRIGDSFVWRVVATYSSRMDPLTRPDLQQIEGPLLRPPEVEWDTITVAVAATHDRDGNPVRNSARDPFDPPLDEEEARLYLRVTKNQLTFDATRMLEFVDTVNSKKWLVFLQGEARCRKIRGVRRWENGLLFWAATYEFEIRKENVPTGAKRVSSFADFPDDPEVKRSWTKWVLDRGFRELVDKVEAEVTALDQSADTATLEIAAGGGDPKFTTGQAVTVGNTAGGLDKDKTYYVRNRGDGKYSFHTTPVHAVNDQSKVDIDTPLFGEKITSATRQRHILDPHWKQFITTPALLDGSGKQLPANATPVYLGFDWYPEKDFNELNIF